MSTLLWPSKMTTDTDSVGYRTELSGRLELTINSGAAGSSSTTTGPGSAADLCGNCSSKRRVGHPAYRTMRNSSSAVANLVEAKHRESSRCRELLPKDASHEAFADQRRSSPSAPSDAPPGCAPLDRTRQGRRVGQRPRHRKRCNIADIQKGADRLCARTTLGAPAL